MITYRRYILHETEFDGEVTALAAYAKDSENPRIAGRALLDADGNVLLDGMGLQGTVELDGLRRLVGGDPDAHLLLDLEPPAGTAV